jgi:hypothetical protein
VAFQALNAGAGHRYHPTVFLSEPDWSQDPSAPAIKDVFLRQIGAVGAVGAASASGITKEKLGRRSGLSFQFGTMTDGGFSRQSWKRSLNGQGENCLHDPSFPFQLRMEKENNEIQKKRKGKEQGRAFLPHSMARSAIRPPCASTL